MTAIVWLIFVSLGAFVLFVVAGVIDAITERRPLPRVAQPVRPALPPSWSEPELYRARQARAARARRRSAAGGAR
ncbi:hypothetical protein OIE43_18945 [Streptomyces pseudovenezuelae]|uniref:hypothetical protein n=1 Tax=Streptomyces pseudovenezuelae TaxID=67350 RepID=UPI002E30486A|nr:hypothetical protein [Streptomyces pseudovenezuelae]